MHHVGRRILHDGDAGRAIPAEFGSLDVHDARRRGDGSETKGREGGKGSNEIASVHGMTPKG
jgi:hypothetical protein